MSEIPALPAHIEETVQAIRQLHAEHHERATLLQRLAERMTSFIGRPVFLAGLSAVILGWILGNLLIIWAGLAPLDSPPFVWLSTAATIFGVYVAVLILTTQRSEDQLAWLSEHLTLELAMLSEQKSAKVIELLEELRRDHPGRRDRADPEARAMSAPSDPQAVIKALRATRRDG
jgi:uncharacterized membrane protein